MAQNVNILFGFDECPVSKQVVTCLKSKGFTVQVAYRPTKNSIQDYVKRYPSYDTLVLREGMGDEAFSATELAALNDSSLHNIVVLVDEAHKGTAFMQVLYSAGITSALFDSGASGASDADILNLILHPRSNKRARYYYGMVDMKAQVNLLTSDSYVKNYSYLLDESKGVNIIDRYVSIINRLPVDQGVAFTKRLPAATLKRIMQYEEFYKVMTMFGKRGYKLKYKKPKNLKKGMTDEAFEEYIKGKSPAQIRGSVQRGRKNERPSNTSKPQKKSKPVKEKKAASLKKNAERKPSPTGGSAFFGEEEERRARVKSKQRINWKLILIILAVGLLLLTIFFFVLKYTML